MLANNDWTVPMENKRFQEIMLKWNTAKYYKPSQLTNRAVAKIRIKLEGFINLKETYLKLYTKDLRQGLNALGERSLPFFTERAEIEIPSDVLQKSRSVCSSIQSFTFTFLNKEVVFPHEMQWKGPFPSTLWGYNLHYFDYVPHFAIVVQQDNDHQAYEFLKRLVIDWYSHYDFQDRIASASYVISLRMMNLLILIKHLWLWLQNDPEFTELLYSCLYVDFVHLSRHKEVDVRGNHLLKNLKSLVVVGLFLGTPRTVKIAHASLKQLCQQLHEQFLEDGGHFERSPMYHVISTQDLLEAIAILQLFECSVPEVLRDKACKALFFLSCLVHPDREIPLFGDSAFGISSHPDEVFDLGQRTLGILPVGAHLKTGTPSIVLARDGYPDAVGVLPVSEPVHLMAETGYCVFESPYGKLIMDCGDLGPDYLPGHAHNDMLSYELSVRGERLITDTGVHTYESGEMRQIARSTMSHNTLTVEWQEQSEIWSAFRMGRRGRIISQQFMKKKNFYSLRAAHNAFAPTIHERAIYQHESGMWIVLDHVRNSMGHNKTSYIHVSPGHTITQSCGMYNIAGLSIVPIHPSLEPLTIEIEKSPYFPEFGLSVERDRLKFNTNSELFGYALIPYDVTSCKVEIISSSEMLVNVNGEEFSLPLGE